MRELELWRAAAAPQLEMLEHELGEPGNGGRRTVRGRLHHLESTEAAAQAVALALETVKATRERAITRRQAYVALALAILSTPVVDLVLRHL